MAEKEAKKEAPIALDGEEMSFKEGMERLEGIVRKLESGDLELEESLAMYAKGVSLLSDLQRCLDDAQQQVEVLMGQLEDAPDDDVQDTTLSNA